MESQPELGINDLMVTGTQPLEVTNEVFNEDPEAPQKSKNQLKREARLVRITTQRKDLRKKEKERRKERGIVNLAVKTNIETGETTKFHRKHLKSNLMTNSACKLRIAIDCSFESMMSDSDIRLLLE